MYQHTSTLFQLTLDIVINGIISTDPGINVVCPDHKPIIDSTIGLNGSLRYNGSSRNIEVFTHGVFIPINTAVATVALAPETNQILAWARSKMQEEADIIKLARKSESVAMALENLNKAKEQLMIVATLSKTHE